MPQKIWAGAGRPSRRDARLRKANFLSLVAAGVDPLAAQRQAGISIERAFRIVADPGFQDVIKALREEVAA